MLETIMDIITVIAISFGICLIYYMISRGIGSLKYRDKDGDDP